METFFTYFLKSAGILTLFYLMYELLLQKETFFKANRFFLLGGMACALVLPLVTFTRTVIVAVPNVTNTTFSENTTGLQETSGLAHSPAFTLWEVVFFIYGMGVLFLLLRLVLQILSFRKLIRRSNVFEKEGFKFVETTDQTAPFSFLRFIVFNPLMHNEKELPVILEHEKEHVLQKHSADILCAHVFAIFQWINPFVWSYRKSIVKNLEYMADKKVCSQYSSQKTYQYILIKNVAGNFQLALSNTFFNSLTKKRIVMLNKNRSQKRKAWKYSLIAPLLIAFIAFFNVKTIAQVQETKLKINGKATEKLEVIIDNHTKDKDLDSYREKFAEKNVDLKFSKVKRNSNGKITGIKVQMDDNKGQTASYNVKQTDPIERFTIRQDFDNEGNSRNISIGNTVKSSNYKKVKVITSDGEDEIIEIMGPDGEIEVIDVMKVVNDENERVKKVRIATASGGNANSKAVIVVDGDVVTEEELINLETDKISHIEVAKGENKIKVYTKKDQDENAVMIHTDKENHKLELKGADDAIFFINGKASARKAFEKLDPNTIKSVKIIKKENEQSVIEITTKN
ncbi:M56 family metallopeptidase [Ascidiimonas aurantiaca]|uniref:M56 family metallopeptidase n=1 Tax=Ascidiimonas aurantiaca TaxID=1685432 RepID=UPI0030EEC721